MPSVEGISASYSDSMLRLLFAVPGHTTFDRSCPPGQSVMVWNLVFPVDLQTKGLGIPAVPVPGVALPPSEPVSKHDLHCLGQLRCLPQQWCPPCHNNGLWVP